MAEKPRLLVIDRDSSHGKSTPRLPVRVVRAGDGPHDLEGACAAARPEVRRGLRRCLAALGRALGRDDDPGRGDPGRDLRRRRRGRPGPADHLGQPRVSFADRFGDARSVGCPFYQALGQAGDPGPGPVPVHVGGRLEGAGEHGDEDRGQPVPPARRSRRSSMRRTR